MIYRQDAYALYVQRRLAYRFSVPSFGLWLAWQLHYKHVRKGAKHLPHCFINNSWPQFKLR